MKIWRIGVAYRLCGIAHSVYESIGLLKRVQRQANG